MTLRRLECWQPSRQARSLQLWAGARRPQRDRLELRYCLHAAPGSLRAPPSLSLDAEVPGHPPLRLDGLWQHTCLEAFIAARGDKRYWELNLALNGDWNVYRFDAYRDAQVQEPSVTSLPFAITVQPQIEHQAARTELVVYPCLPSHLARADRLDVGLTAVLEHVDATLSYWALTHPAAQPDFHDRRGWVLRL